MRLVEVFVLETCEKPPASNPLCHCDGQCSNDTSLVQTSMLCIYVCMILSNSGLNIALAIRIAGSNSQLDTKCYKKVLHVIPRTSLRTYAASQTRIHFHSDVGSTSVSAYRPVMPIVYCLYRSALQFVPHFQHIISIEYACLTVHVRFIALVCVM